ncbi:hypothetical protein JYU09_01150 [bacterium AH-315-O15]|nr:hypothetical protein [bacterium AH-315-O15]
MLDGPVIGDCMPRHRHQEFVRFLKKIDAETPPALDLHVIVANSGTHTSPGAEFSCAETVLVDGFLAKIARRKEALDALH